MNVLEMYKKETSDLPVLGYLVWWTIRRVNISNVQLNELYVKHNLKKYFPKHTSPRKCFWRALQKFGKRNPELLVRKIGENDKRIVYGIVAEGKKFETLDLEYQVECRVTFYKKDHTLEYSKSQHPVAKELGELYTKYLTHYVSDDIRKAILKAFVSLDSLDVRSQGGVYFVPVKYSETVACFDSLISEINDTSSLYSVSIIDTVRTRKIMYKAFMEQADNELKEAEAEITNIQRNMNVRKDTIERRLLHFKKLRDKARLYADLFKSKAIDIEGRINQVEKVALEVLDKMTDVA